MAKRGKAKRTVKATRSAAGGGRASAAKRGAPKRTGTKRTAAKRTAAKRTAKKQAAAKEPAAKGRAAKTKATKPKPAQRAVKRTTRKRPPAAKKPTALGAARTAVAGAVAGAVAAVTTRLPRDTDALALLEADHRRIEDLLKQGEDTTERALDTRGKLLETITAELDSHELIEEQILYPALKAHPEAKDIVLEGFQEHHVADLIVKELQALSPGHEQWGAKFKVLKENIEHHIQEEEGTMFRTARGLFSRQELQAMGARMKAMKEGRQSS